MFVGPENIQALAVSCLQPALMCGFKISENTAGTLEIALKAHLRQCLRVRQCLRFRCVLLGGCSPREVPVVQLFSITSNSVAHRTQLNKRYAARHEKSESESSCSLHCLRSGSADLPRPQSADATKKTARGSGMDTGSTRLPTGAPVRPAFAPLPPFFCTFCIDCLRRSCTPPAEAAHIHPCEWE